MNVLYILVVVSAWSSNPIFRRAFIDRVGDSADGAATYVVWNSIACAAISIVSTAVKTTKLAPVNDTALIGLVAGTATLGVVSTYLMNIMMSEDNPGKVTCVVSGTNNLVVYVIGSLLYGRIEPKGVFGALLIAAGIALIKNTKAA